VSALFQSSVGISLILQVMFFLQALNSCYQDLLTQFASKQKDLSSVKIDSMVADATFMGKLIVVGVTPKSGTPGAPPCTPAAAKVVTDKDGKEHCSPWEWLTTFDSASIVSRLRQSLKGGFYCAFCNSKEKHHDPYKCPLFEELGLKLIKVGGQGGGGQLGGSTSAGTSSKPPTVAFPALAPTAVGSPPAPAPGSASAPAGLMAAVIQGGEGNESSTNSFRWYGDEDGAEFKPNTAVSDYLPSQTLDLFSSCCHASVPTHAPRPSLLVPRSSASTSLDSSGWTVIKLPSKLVSALHLKAVSPEALGTALQLVVADTGAIDHVLLDLSAFI
jgi:hypothetical protein